MLMQLLHYYIEELDNSMLLSVIFPELHEKACDCLQKGKKTAAKM